MPFELSKAAKALLAVVAVEFLLSLALTVWRIVTLLQEADAGDTEAIADTITAAVLLVNLCFFGFHCFVGVTREQTEAMLAFCFANVLLTAYEVFRFINKCLQADSFYGLDPLNYVRFFSVAVLSPVSLGLAIYVMRNFGWRDYKLVGADTELLSMFKTFKRFVTFMIIDLQMGMTLATFGVVTFFVDEGEAIFDVVDIVVFGVFVAITFAWILLGYVAARRERKSAMILWFVMAIVEPAYISYCIYVFYTNDAYEAYTDITRPFVVLSVLALIVRLAAFIVAIRAYLNFGRGLVQRVFRRIDGAAGNVNDDLDDDVIPALHINM